MSRLLPRLRQPTPSTTLFRSSLPAHKLPFFARPSSSFDAPPSPPKLPPEQQAEFERLQREAAVTTAFSPTPASTSEETQSSTTAAATSSSSSSAEEDNGDGGRDPNQGIFRGAPPEFQGEVNPKTGEVGGPKNEPLRWGGGGEWSYNGRATDF